jgi:hypothetical protein
MLTVGRLVRKPLRVRSFDDDVLERFLKCFGHCPGPTQDDSRFEGANNQLACSLAKYAAAA